MTSYVPGRSTALVSDWSKTGIGYTLQQKHCKCTGMALNCCTTGWKVVCIGSRFLTKSEGNYAAIEGELLGVLFALEKTRLWTVGDKQLYIFTDHKPLVGLLMNKNIDDISTSKLQRMVERTRKWNLNVHHVPGL